MSAPTRSYVDHLDGNPHNNTLSNVRVVTLEQLRAKADAATRHAAITTAWAKGIAARGLADAAAAQRDVVTAEALASVARHNADLAAAHEHVALLRACDRADAITP